jgi:hypothetical protein
MKKLKLNEQKCGLLLLAITMIFLSSTIVAQMPAAITIDPPNASAYDELTLTFDPALACFQSGSLSGLPSIAIHSGVTFITGEIWQHVVNFDGIGYNGQPTTLMPTGDGKFYITYIPADFYGLTGQTVTQICAVFNNGTDWSQDGRDFIPNTSNCMDFFIPINFQGTDPEFHFNLNMNKMISEGNFDPAADLVYVEMDEVGTVLLTDPDQDGIYEGIVDEGIEVDSTYFYQFRINNDQYESLIREITAFAGVITIDVWWNDDPLPQITFVIDMIYQAQLGTYNENTDFVDVVGTMNNWEGSPAMEHAGFYLLSITLICEPGIVEYKFRINGNVTTIENFGSGINRMTFATPEPQSIYHYFNDVNWDTWPATFEVDMNAEISAGNFDPSTDYLDVAGTFNNWDAHCVLFDREWTEPGIYTANILVNKLDPYIEFKFRINGDWWTSEFPLGGPNRFWTVQDTTGGLIDLFTCVYNITDIPYPPYVYDLFISGDLVVGNEITGNYTYFDPNADLEGESVFQWFVSDDPSGGNAVSINGAVFQSYTITPDNYGKYLIFQVTPVATTGEPSVGYPAAVISGQIGAIDIPEIVESSIQLHPNPANQILYISSPEKIERIEVYDLFGQMHDLAKHYNSNEVSIRLSELKIGIYFLKCFDHDGNYSTLKFIKL